MVRLHLLYAQLIYIFAAMDLKQLQDQFSQAGKVIWIGVRPARYEPLLQLKQVNALEDQRLEGDHFGGRPGSKRQVSLIQEEHLEVVASYLNQDAIDPMLTRRNIVTRGINLNALKQRAFKIGTAVFQGTGECAPCSRMEKNLGKGGWNAMRGHGGIVARILKPGVIKVGDSIELVAEEPQ